MIISLPNDGRGLLYHVIDLQGQIVHTYRDFDAAYKALEGGQRITIQDDASRKWLTQSSEPMTKDAPYTADIIVLNGRVINKLFYTANLSNGWYALYAKAKSE